MYDRSSGVSHVRWCRSRCGTDCWETSAVQEIGFDPTEWDPRAGLNPRVKAFKMKLPNDDTESLDVEWSVAKEEEEPIPPTEPDPVVAVGGANPWMDEVDLEVEFCTAGERQFSRQFLIFFEACTGDEIGDGSGETGQ